MSGSIPHTLDTIDSKEFLELLFWSTDIHTPLADHNLNDFVLRIDINQHLTNNTDAFSSYVMQNIRFLQCNRFNVVSTCVSTIATLATPRLRLNHSPRHSNLNLCPRPTSMDFSMAELGPEADLAGEVNGAH